MSQVRFKIGIPRVGSAARAAEGESSIAPLNLPSGGSAARSAEDRKKAESTNEPGARILANISLRGQNGGVSQRPATTPLSTSKSTAYGQAIRAAMAPSEDLPGNDSPALPEANRTKSNLPTLVPASPPTTSADGTTSVTSSPGVLQTTAVRFQSLLRSLFFSGDAAGKS